ncbi:Kontroller of growth [Metschnikowia bicuspidata var. bicuspidata NRRL YB-4993]|uniref:Kontroller of growth n=1 Tax=Metschnikowia bicuspidata var. bicuspidata NRRL YB-4993 TaxID=869754 RepID=A0A1A0HJ43_9ASCO|nr:Kontroller of growth [Metschnikowia bicuspidata var. bicuspidata NRRL YB-4993]OBA24035.1 Kontroller of growth [Metschnikowia bicuspidata var. bicuspidata NRRL YB-4993]
MRHGFAEEYNSETFLSSLANNFYIYYDDKRHNANGTPMLARVKSLPPHAKNYQPIVDWKIMKDRQKTVSAVLVLCLNLGVDPPDIMRPYPCAKDEAWCDPADFPDTKKATEAIGKGLQNQYEALSLRTRYKQSLDPCVEDVKRFCNTLRRNAKDERILFHYNGHGVPKPTASGEIWVFNRGYTQYIPISLYDLQTWLGAPVIFVYDCNSAGNIVHNFKKFVQKRIDDDNEGNHDMSAPSPTAAYLDSIQLAACKSHEVLPMSPHLPADLFTCCLTCPIDISLRWFVMQLPLRESYYLMLPRNATGNVVVPGKLTDRRTPLGELNWIFTAITDTIAWTSLSRPIFKRLFRQDLMVAALFRNFLLAKRIMPHLNCNPVSDPPLPESVRFHPMWDSWDLAIDQVFAQLIRNNGPDPFSYPPPEPQGKPAPPAEKPAALHSASNGSISTHSAVSSGAIQPLSNYQHSTFFEQQLTAFEIWLKYAGSSTKDPPEQLPIVLQVLLSQVHRLRALILLLKFLDLGPWAVYLSLSIGIFPYVLKLLQSPAQELKPVLIFIWARIMAIDHTSTQQELCKDKGYNYFYLILNSSPSNPIGAPGAPGGSINHGSGSNSVIVNDDHKAMSAFILTLFIKDFRNGQRLCFSIELVTNCLKFVASSENPLLRQWCCLLLSQLWLKYPEGKWIIYKDGYLARFLDLVNDPIPEVRTSIIIALTTFLTDILDDPSGQPLKDTNGGANNVSADLRKDELRQQDLKLANVILKLLGDGSTIVRKEIVFFINRFIKIYDKFFLVVAFNQLEEEIVLIDNPNNLQEFRKKSPAYGSIFSSIWKALLILSEDPHIEVKELAETLIDSVMVKLNESELAGLVKEMQEYLLSKSTINIKDNFKSAPIVDRTPIAMQRDNAKRQASSGSVINRRNELTMNGGSLKTRSVSYHTGKADSANSLDSSSITSRLKDFGISKLFKSFHINEDTDLNNFKRILNSGPVTSHYGVEYQPKSPRYHLREEHNKTQLPDQSGFFEYSCETFQEPQMSKSEVDEPGSEEYVKRLWRRNRNEQTIQETQPQKKMALRGDWNRNLTVLSNKTQPKLIEFMQFEKLLVSTDEKDTVTVWDWESNNVVHKFSNGNPFGTKITDLKILNEDDIPLVLTGSSDGVVKIYKDFHIEDDSEENSVKIVAAWRALTDLLLTSKSSGLISEWQQSRGSLLISGDVKIIRVWDAPRELCLSDIPARSSSSITSLTSDQVAGDIFVAGFDDGSLRVYDRRLDSRESMVKIWQNGRGGAKNFGRGSIRNVHMQRGGFRELVSGSADGFINLWDIRSSLPVSTFTGTEKSIRSIDVHEHAPIITTGSQAVNIWTTSGDIVSTLRNPHDTYLTNRTSNYLSRISFHPHRMMLATNYNQDGHINIYTCADIISEY